MTCPLYSRVRDKHDCHRYGEQDETKAAEDCMRDFESCFKNAGERLSIERASLNEYKSSQREDSRVQNYQQLTTSDRHLF